MNYKDTIVFTAVSRAAATADLRCLMPNKKDEIRKSEIKNNEIKNNAIKDRLARYRQIKLTVIGRKSGRTISVPVWFVLEGETLYLLPVSGSNTQWYKNVLKNPEIHVDARDAGADLKAIAITDTTTVKSVIEKFREKYGAGDVKKYYSTFDVAVVAELT